MRTLHHPTKGTFAILLIATGAAALLGVLQQRKLLTLREEIASARQERIASTGSVEKQDKPRDRDGLVVEALDLLDVLIAPNAPDLAKRTERLMELLQMADAAAVRSLLGKVGNGSDESDLSKALRWRFSQANPRESFLLGLDDPPSSQLKDVLLWDFRGWANLDPSGALRWYAEAEERNLPLAKEEEMLIAVFAARARLDPKRAIEGFRQHFGVDAGSGAKLAIPRLVGSLRNQGERMGFMVALNRNTAEDSGHGSFREAVVSELSKALVKEPFDEVSLLVDGTFTAEERVKFARNLTQGGFLNPDTWPRWAPWIAALDLPAERGQPIDTMAVIVARNKKRFKDVQWLADLPAGPQRDLAVESYAMVSLESDLDEAIRWMDYLPAGERRKGVAANVARYLEMKDPAAAEALRSKEGVE